MSSSDEPEEPRRKFLATSARLGMAGGLLAGYGAFGAVAGRFLYPAHDRETVRLFVAVVHEMAAGASMTFLGPAGERIAIARRAEAGTAEDFVALSSICPHLGCQVHWEGDHDRFFCPCHNGVFDPEGRALEGPPAKAGQSLSRYRLFVDGGLLYIEVPV